MWQMGLPKTDSELQVWSQNHTSNPSLRWAKKESNHYWCCCTVPEFFGKIFFLDRAEIALDYPGIAWTCHGTQEEGHFHWTPQFLNVIYVNLPSIRWHNILSQMNFQGSFLFHWVLILASFVIVSGHLSYYSKYCTAIPTEICHNLQILFFQLDSLIDYTW